MVKDWTKPTLNLNWTLEFLPRSFWEKINKSISKLENLRIQIKFPTIHKSDWNKEVTTNWIKLYSSRMSSYNTCWKFRSQGIQQLSKSKWSQPCVKMNLTTCRISKFQLDKLVMSFATSHVEIHVENFYK